jgi:hypothetical protein
MGDNSPPPTDYHPYSQGYDQGWKDCWQFLQNIFMPRDFYTYDK